MPASEINSEINNVISFKDGLPQSAMAPAPCQILSSKWQRFCQKKDKRPAWVAKDLLLEVRRLWLKDKIKEKEMLWEVIKLSRQIQEEKPLAAFKINDEVMQTLADFEGYMRRPQNSEKRLAAAFPRIRPDAKKRPFVVESFDRGVASTGGYHVGKKCGAAGSPPF